MGRAPCCDKVGLNKGKWTKEEDEILANYIKAHGEGSWRSLPKKAGLLRCGKSCRLRWINYLRSGLKRGSFSRQEDELIIKLHASLGNRWSLIANELPGRTDNDIKNYWNSHLSRSIDSYHVIRDGNTDAKSAKPLKNSNKNSQKSNAKTGRPTKKILKRKIVVHKPPNHQNSSQDCNNEIQSEFSSLSDEALWNNTDDFLNSPFSPIIFDNLESWKLEPIQAPSEFSCTTDEPSSTSKEEITNAPSSPDLSSIFKEMDNLLYSEVKITNEEHGDYNSMPVDMENVQTDVGVEEKSRFWDFGCMDFMWDLDLWSSVRPVEYDE